MSNSSCEANFIISSPNNLPLVNQTMPITSVNVSVTLTAACTNCTLTLTPKQFSGNATFYFGGIILPTTGLPPVLCNQNFTLSPRNSWGDYTDVSTPLDNDLANNPYPQGCSSKIRQYGTGANGTYASLNFTGSGVTVFGKIILGEAEYNIVRRHSLESFLTSMINFTDTRWTTIRHFPKT
jgi:hypothetical protein